MGIELPLKGIDLSPFPSDSDKIYLLMQWRHLCPREYFNDGSWHRLGQFDVTPKAGIIESGLAPLTADMRDTYPFQMESFFIRGKMKISQQGFQEGGVRWGQTRYDGILEPG